MHEKKKLPEKKFQVLKRQKPWRDAYYYQKTETLYQLTFAFCQRFLPSFGDRTVDQMKQAARSGKQNIVEGTEDGETSTEMYIRLLNVARSSLQELREDYRDYLLSRNLTLWTKGHPRYADMQEYCYNHNKIEEYLHYLKQWNDEELANTALTLCYQTDSMLNSRLKKLEKEFIEQGGIKERMYAARTGYRQAQEEELTRLRNEVQRLQALLKEHGIDY